MKNPFRQKLNALRGMNPQLRLFLLAVGMIGISGAIFETTFNQYIKDIFDMDAMQRGVLEFPRELPGFLCALMVGLLFFVSETVIAGIAALAVGLGMIGLGLFGGEWIPMILLMVFWSLGVHLLMPVNASISMDLAEKGKLGRRMGEVQAVGAAAQISACLLVLLAFHLIDPQDEPPLTLGDYTPTFLIGGLAAFIAAGLFFKMKLPGRHIRRSKMIVKKRYWLYYTLALLFGIRKQIFITFGAWVLLRIYDQPVETIPALWLAGVSLNVVFLPILGRLLDRFGERTILVADSICIVMICSGYGLAKFLPNQQLALWLVYGCYVADMMLFGVNMARSTYVSKIAAKGDVSPTLSVGVTINHAASMSLPMVGGWIWMEFGYAWVFASAAAVAVLMGLFSAMIPSKATLHQMSEAKAEV